ncbi:MAG: Crp/Fnr family transcriptional regulator [Calditrichaeota bacterium]|nr:Crp/Fnr family transcriptional regulator [Calditrichota bacterium]
MDSHGLRQLKSAIQTFESQPLSVWQALASRTYPRSLNRQDHFSQAGDYATEFAFLQEGVLRIYCLSEAGEEWNKHFLLEDDFFMAGIVPGQRTDVNIQALTPAKLICISFQELRMLMNRHPSLNTFFQKLLLRYLLEKHRKEAFFLSASGREKYRYFLQRFPGLENRIAQYQIARYLGITPTQLSRIRRQIQHVDSPG